MSRRDYFTYIGAVFLILIRDNTILLQRRFQTGHEDGRYGVPSGHIEGDETIRAACAREMREEIGITVVPDNLQLVHVMHRKKQGSERLDFYMITPTYAGEVHNCEPHKCDDLAWFPLNALPENTIPYVRQAIECYRDDMPYSEFGWGCV